MFKDLWHENDRSSRADHHSALSQSHYQLHHDGAYREWRRRRRRMCLVPMMKSGEGASCLPLLQSGSLKDGCISQEETVLDHNEECDQKDDC